MSVSNKPTGRLRHDLLAGLVLAVSSIPDAMASAVLAGASPVRGLFAVMAGQPVAALTTGSVFMVVTTTSAMSLAAGSALAGLAPGERGSALVLVTLVAGLVQLALGALRAGFLTYHISHAVMTGFFTGISILVVLSQLPDLTGIAGGGGRGLFGTLDLLSRLDRVHLPTLAVGLLAMVAVLALSRTRLKPVAMLGGLVLATALVPLFGWRSVPLIGAVSPIPRALPVPALPDLTKLPDVLAAGLAVALIGLVQGAGVSQTKPNPDGRFANPSRDFLGQGAANVASALVGGMPVGGSVSATALASGAGARSRWTQIIAALFVLVIVLALGGLVGLVPAAALGALLVLAGIGAIDPHRIATVWHTSWTARTAMALTFAATLLLPIEIAVLLGVLASFALEQWRVAENVRLVELAIDPEGRTIEQPAPATLPDGHPTVLLIYGTLSFATVRGLEPRLPRADGVHRAVVLLVLRGRSLLGSTFFTVLERYVHTVRAGGGRVFLVGVGQVVRRQIEETGLDDVLGPGCVFPAEAAIGAALDRALAEARAWLAVPEDRPVAPA